MGVCSSSLSDAEKQELKISKEIDKQLQDDSVLIDDEVKLLLLGPGESGKSTIFKQMKIIQDEGGYTDDERKQFLPIVYGNIISQMQVIIKAANKLDFEWSNSEISDLTDSILAVNAGTDEWSSSIGEDIQKLWKTDDVQAVFEKRNKSYQLNDSAAYFFDAIPRVLESSYVPTEDDILRVRVRSTGIEEAEFDFGDLCFRMLDVGGQKTERRKWIHCFDCVTAVLFCASLSSFDQVLREDSSTNRLDDALELFQEITNSPWFSDTPIILFMNKTDLFEEKFEQFKAAFSNFSGSSIEDGQKFLLQKFLDLNSNDNKHAIYSHFTCAIDTKNIKIVFDSVNKTILDDIMKQIIV